jgi:hypothetical protein
VECAILIGVAFVIFLVAFVAHGVRTFRAARAAYYASLERLKGDPHNPELREETLALGRRYSHLSRNSQGVTLYDEVALANDIAAACARAGAPARPGPTVEQRLTQLDDLRARGLITPEECQARRAQILAEL